MGRNNPYVDAYTPNLLLVFSPLPLVTRDSGVLHGGGTSGAAFLSESFVGMHYGRSAPHPIIIYPPYHHHHTYPRIANIHILF